MYRIWRMPPALALIILLQACVSGGSPGIDMRAASENPTASSAREPSPAPQAGSQDHRPKTKKSLSRKDVSAFYGRTLNTLGVRRRVVALSFDGGGDAGGAPAILRTLVRARAPATFFLTGRWVQLYPKLARTIGAHYDIGNHTYDHPDLTKLPNPAVKREIVKAQRLIQHATGRSPRPLFRFPFGSSDRRVMHIVNSLGYVSIGWTTDTLGWLGTSGGQSVASVRSHALTGLRPGAIILMHLGANPQDHSALDAQALPGIIAGLRQRGYRIVGIDRVLQQG